MTLNQKIKKGLKKLSKKTSKPQIKGVIVKVFTCTPKKPNSALRKVANVLIKNNNQFKIISAYIPGEKHSLIPHNVVLIRPGKTQDLPGFKYKIIRGVLDCK